MGQIRTVMTEIKRGPYHGILYQVNGRYIGELSHDNKVVKTSAPMDDQDEAEVELGQMIDEAWRKAAGSNKGLKRRI